ncbi:MAG TPA: sensor domain-containing diguanylate cyclase [Thermoanaerobaculia bacterium]|jgi:diguanylate cyclase (GGDEF)-like protein
MPRFTQHRVYRVAVVVLTVLAAVSLLAFRPPTHLVATLVFAVLVLVARYLDGETGEAGVGFDAAAIFGAVIVTHDAGVAFIAAFLGYTAYALTQKKSVVRASEAALAYGALAWLYTLVPLPPLVAAPLLVAGYLAAHRFRAAALRTTLLIAPVVTIEVLLHNTYGIAGFVIGFVPVPILAYAIRTATLTAVKHADLVRRNRDLAILTESSTQILSAEGEVETLQRLMALLSKLAALKACAVVTWEAHPDVAGTVHRFGACAPDDQEILRWVESAGFSHSAPSRAFVFQSGMRKFPLSHGDAIQVLIGLQTAEVIYGVLIFETEERTILKSDSLNFFTLLVTQTALSLQDQLLRREMREKTVQLEQHAATMATILEVSNSLIGEVDVEAALARIVQSIHRSVGFEVTIHVWRELTQAALPEERDDTLLVPLHSADEMLGYLLVQVPDRRTPTPEQVRTLEIFATQAVTALQSARQYEEIKRLTIIDPLTPAYNHRYFQQTLAKEIHRHARRNGELALAMLDIDNFKLINDSFGHPIGDEILKGLVDVLMTNARDTDVIARYGGEEFAIIFPDTPSTAARDAANRLRELVERREFIRGLRVTVSVGVSCYPRDGMTAADLIARADAALYAAKRFGKNQVVQGEAIEGHGLGLRTH